MSTASWPASTDPVLRLPQRQGPLPLRHHRRIPAAYHLITSVPQTETIAGGQRVVRGRTILATFALSLLYDRRWRPRSRRLGTVRLDVFATPDFDTTVATVMKEFEGIYRFAGSWRRGWNRHRLHDWRAGSRGTM